MVRPIIEGLYEGVGQLARAASALVPAGGSKLQRTLRGRVGLRERYVEWARTGRDRDRPLLWMHAPSVGEGLQARPVLEIIRRMRPDVQLAYTHFSSSAVGFAQALDVDFRDYLPFDTAESAAWSVAALRPSALVFSKLDVWPTLAVHSSRTGVRLGLISATVAPGSARYRDPVRWLMRPAYERLDLVGAVARDHADRLIEMGVRRAAIRVTGDTRYDQVWSRAHSVDRGSPLLSRFGSVRPTVVAGSTWPADEGVLLPAWAEVRAAVPTARLIIAPHEPTAEHLTALERAIDQHGWQRARLSADHISDADVVIVDRLGALGELYALASASFVGGGFHAAGLHSVLEPAAFGSPVLFGPRFSNSRDAERLVARGGGSSAANVHELSERLTLWLRDRSTRANVSERAREAVREGLGAAERSAEIVLELLAGAKPAP